MIRIGVLGATSMIDRAILQPLKLIGNASLFGIASSSRERAMKYAEAGKGVRYFSDYAELLACPEVDLVYIPLANHLHAEWVVKSLRSGKNVLVEKPICLSTAEIVSIREALANADGNLLLVEGLMIRHHCWQTWLRETIQTGTYGALRSIDMQCSMLYKDPSQTNYRNYPHRGGGAFRDFGPYWLQIVQYFIEGDPQVADGNSEYSGPNGCDWTFYARMLFDGGVQSSFIASFEMPNKNSVAFELEHASVVVSDLFRCAYGSHKLHLQVYKRGEPADRVTFEPDNYFTNQLAFILGAIDGNQESEDIERAFERITRMEQIELSAKSKNRRKT